MAKKLKVITKDLAQVKRHVDLLRISGRPYEILLSNYTTELRGEINIQFMRSKKSNSVFAAFAKIKMDINKCGISKPEIDKTALRYYDALKAPGNMNIKQVYNIDLKSAYAYALFNSGYISTDTFNYISRLPKLDRLAAVGMLASRKEHFFYNESNELYKYEKHISEYENYFWYCVKYTSEVMQAAKLMLGNSFLFSWVDGIYFSDKSKISVIKAFLERINFPHHVEILHDFELRVESDYYLISFEKDYREKCFNIPMNKGTFVKDILRYINPKLI